MLLRFASATDNLSLLSQPVRQPFSVLRLSAKPRVRTCLSTHSSPTLLRITNGVSQMVSLSRPIFETFRLERFRTSHARVDRNLLLFAIHATTKITVSCEFSVQNLSLLWRTVEKKLLCGKLHYLRCICSNFEPAKVQKITVHPTQYCDPIR